MSDTTSFNNHTLTSRYSPILLLKRFVLINNQQEFVRRPFPFADGNKYLSISNMPILRVSPLFRSLAAPRQISRATAAFQSLHQRRPYAHESSSYGGGEGDPKGETPQEQGSNPSAELEHPGPPPPKAGQGTGGGPTKAGSEGQNTQQNDSSSGQGKGSSGGVSGSSQPKILGENNPKHSEDVKAHNEDMKKRHDRATESAEEDGSDNVGKGFWSGEYALTF